MNGEFKKVQKKKNEETGCWEGRTTKKRNAFQIQEWLEVRRKENNNNNNNNDSSKPQQIISAQQHLAGEPNRRWTRSTDIFRVHPWLDRSPWRFNHLSWVAFISGFRNDRFKMSFRSKRYIFFFFMCPCFGVSTEQVFRRIKIFHCSVRPLSNDEDLRKF